MQPSVVLIILSAACVCIGVAQSAKITSAQNSDALAATESMKSDEPIVSSLTDADTADEEDDIDVEDEEEVNVNVNSVKESQVKTAVQAAEPTSLSVWGIVSDLWNWLKTDISETFLQNGSSAPAAEGRTFGKIRRLQMALIPIIFKFGVLSAMVAFLVVLGMKSLFLLKVLVLMNAAVILGKFLTFKSNFGHWENSAPQAYNSWNPHVHHEWSAAPLGHISPHKEIHLHIHGGQVQPQVSGYSSYGTGVQNGWESRNDPYFAYEPTAVTSETNAQTEFNKPATIQIVPNNYPTNHLTY